MDINKELEKDGLQREIALTKDLIEKRYGKPLDEITVDDIYFGTKRKCDS